MNNNNTHYTFTSNPGQARPGQMVLVTLPGDRERENWAELLISNELAGQYVEVVVVVVRIDQDRCDVC